MLLISSSDPVANAMVVEEKANGTPMVCLNGRNLSKVLEPDPYPTPSFTPA